MGLADRWSIHLAVPLALALQPAHPRITCQRTALLLKGGWKASYEARVRAMGVTGTTALGRYQQSDDSSPAKVHSVSRVSARSAGFEIRVSLAYNPQDRSVRGA